MEEENVDVLTREQDAEAHRLASVVKYSPNLVNIASLDGRMTFLNEAGEKILGIAQSEIKNFSIIDVIPPEERNLVEKELLPALQEKGFWEGDLEYENVKTKAKTMTHARCFVIKNEKTGKEEFYANVSSDITERKKDEDEIKVEKERYENLFNASADAIMTLEAPSWRFTSVNTAGIKLFKAKDEAEFLACEPWKLSPETQPDGKRSDEKAKAMIEEAMKKGINLFEWVHKKVSGEEFFAEVLLSRVKQGEEFFLLASVRDIMERKKIEEKIALSEKKFETIFNFNPACINLTNYEDGKFSDVNDAFLKLTGFQKEELIGKTSLDVGLWQKPEDRAKIIASLKKDGTAPKIETLWRKKNGESVDVQVGAYLIEMNGQKFMLGLIEDITEIKNVGKNMAKHNEELERLNKLMVGRELKMVELKKEIEKLKK